ncbi:Na+-translocating ferredoxin:NAD+ oxidoreductase subunit B [Candidatus Magnetomoraceae bacterium gMMP-15]
MTWVTICLAAGTMISMAIIMSYILGWADKTFHVEFDPRVEAVIDVLPGANCGGCGFIGCGEYAEAVVAGQIPVDKCTVGGSSCAAAIANIMNLEVEESLPYRPIIHCGAHYEERLKRSEYQGEKTCIAANMLADVQGCTYGCLGFGDCVDVCNYDAIQIIDGLATINYDKCIGCSACVKNCPRNIIEMVPFKKSKMLAVNCSNKDFGKQVQEVCKMGCTGCKLCSKASDLFKVKANLSVIDYDRYLPDSAELMAELNKACKKCPRDGLLDFVGQDV